jgi:hypothetical protein
MLRTALLEDLGRAGDLTTDATVPANSHGVSRTELLIECAAALTQPATAVATPSW